MGLGALLILISSYQLFFTPSENTEGLKLGTLTSTLSVVKTKSALALDWRDAASGNSLSENQLVYTDNASSAEIVFTTGTSLTVGENSLIKLRATGSEEAMDLSKGFIRAKLDADRPLKVQMNGEDFVVTGDNADIQINLQDEKGEIGVLAGEVNVVSEGMSETLTPESALAIEGKKIQKKLIHLRVVSPAQNEVRYLAVTPAAVNFSWEPSEKAKVVLSKFPSLKNPSVIEGSSNASMALNPGLYYYRIENDQGTSLLRSMRIVKEEMPNLIRPLSSDSVDVVEGVSNEVLLQWKNSEQLNYELEWDDGELHRAQVRGTRRLVPVRATSTFQWRARIKEEMRPEALWSEWQTVNVNTIKSPVLPVDLKPHDVDYQTYQKPDELIELTWKSETPVGLELREPTGKVHAVRVNSNTYTYKAQSGGTYSWRVQAQDSYFRKSAWTDWKTFTIEDLSQEVSENKIQRIQLKKPDQSITFNWEKEGQTITVFELAKDPQFQTIVKRSETRSDSAQVNVPVVGTYYWRSRQFNDDGTVSSSEPKRVIIEPVPALIKPEKLPDLEVPLEEVPKKSVLWKIFDLILPSAHAEEAKGRVRIELPSKEEGKAYVIRIYRDEELTDLVFEKEVSGKVFEWENAEPGVFYWQYAVVDFWDRKSLFSDPSHLTVKLEAIPEASKVRLLSPIRAQEVNPKIVHLKFSEAANATRYRVEVSQEKDFSRPVLTKAVKKAELLIEDPSFSEGLYYWRVISINRKNVETRSNTGRFTVPAPKERTIIADFPRTFTKSWKPRGFIAWTPSMDSYTFKNGETGKISGTALMGAMVTGTIFKERYILNGEVSRQSGKVFKKESYLFQRLNFDASRSWNLSANHKFSLGGALGQVSGQEYEINDSVVTAKNLSGLNYGLVVRDYYVLNENWETQGRFMYLSGVVKQIELGGEALRHWGKFISTLGASYSMRDYETSSGKQTSLKLSVGIGKEF